MAEIHHDLPVPIARAAALLTALSAACLLAGCPAATSTPKGPGFPTIVASTARVDGDPPAACLVLKGARVILPADLEQELDLSVFRNRTVVIVYSRRQAVSLASLADLDLSLATNADGAPVNLAVDDYALVSVAADGSTSYLETSPLATVRLSK